MTEMPQVSVVVVSHQRPAELRLCLTALAQLDYAPFEVIVVADAPGRAAIAALPFAERIKLVPHDTPGISAARNAGIARAAGQIVAFIDDDAVAEPSWLRRLIEPFSAETVSASGGYVRGRNGFSFQWRGRQVDEEGREDDLAIEGNAPVALPPRHGIAIKTQGTNMAVRRSVLARLGGFDPAYRYFLDETDLNMRLAVAGHDTAIVPLAQVHHGYAANAVRAADRTPTSLFDIGASTAVYLRKFAPEGAIDAALNRLRAGQAARLERFRNRGKLSRNRLSELTEGLEAGIAAGLVRDLAQLPPIGPSDAPFLPFPALPGGKHRLIAGRRISAPRLRLMARQALAGGDRVTLLLLAPTPHHHRMRFTEDGIWEQTGGLFGRSDRGQPPRLTSLAKRVLRERAYWQDLREFER